MVPAPGKGSEKAGAAIKAKKTPKRIQLNRLRISDSLIYEMIKDANAYPDRSQYCSVYFFKKGPLPETAPKKLGGLSWKRAF
jgi:hypothetical protein